jgi:uncharacterized protein YjeT (DUF2065 family)
MWSKLFIGLSLMFVIEGFVMAAGPERFKKTLLDIARLPTNIVRLAGLASMVLGLLMLLFTN